MCTDLEGENMDQLIEALSMAHMLGQSVSELSGEINGSVRLSRSLGFVL